MKVSIGDTGDRPPSRSMTRSASEGAKSGR